ncbi:NAD(P)-binding domain-containing protein [Paractinoplanes atraurantiacus]|uniref:6-phosphogluconate dehydrogenase n=1 Tax=Paractinoplanes atraurantiacus TaxID=1036182 RepID=A0A285K8A4_9ACTN|nr:NAD(P)-binding domain-containing protein [Actinoplanes atraurantiacus]SNY68822.1 6-phosphogluconate dehydrogenase [Actinoplanes atraurantiacus]
MTTIGVVTRGERGAAFVRNLTGHGYRVAVADRTGAADMAKSLSAPRILILLDGSELDDLLAELLPLLEPGDVVADGCASRHSDTGRRAAWMRGSEVLFAGCAIAGRPRTIERGPSYVVGGDRAAYQRLLPLLNATAARFQNVACVAYAGAGSAGHFAGQVYEELVAAEASLAAEAYALVGDRKILQAWQADEMITEAAVPKDQPAPIGALTVTLPEIRAAWNAARAVAYARAFERLRTAGAAYGWGMDLAAVAGAWRGGTALAGRLLTYAREALTATPDRVLLDDPYFALALRDWCPRWRRVVCAATRSGVPVPALATAAEPPVTTSSVDVHSRLLR